MTAQSAPPMGRPRTRDFGLPPRMYRRGTRFYYVASGGKWHSLGSDLDRAKRLWAEYECTGCAGTVDDLVQRYLDLGMEGRAESTRKQYKAFARVIDGQWGKLPCDLLTPHQLARWRDSGIGKGWANGVLSLLRVAYAKGIEWGWCATNPATAVKFNAMPVRDRYLEDDEYRAIRAHLPRWAQVWMDLSYVTALRPGDALGVRWEQVGEALTNRTRKTKVRQAFAMSDDLRAILEEARQRPILGLYVVANDKGRPLSMGRLQAVWRTACGLAGVSGTTPRDVRAKAATDAEAAGLNYQAMLGHSNPAMSARYLKAKRTVQAPTQRRKSFG